MNDDKSGNSIKIFVANDSIVFSKFERKLFSSHKS